MAGVPWLLVSCAFPQPQTKAEFRNVVRRGEGQSEMYERVVDRPLDDVVASFRREEEQCLSRSIRRTTAQGANVSSGESHYRPTLNLLEAGRAELVVQVEHRPKPLGSEMPPGGYYLAIVDMVAQGARTHVTVYGPGVGHDDLMAAFGTWANGEQVSCPLE
jgi:hypothetical protein